jgi:exonuclease SbcC
LRPLELRLKGLRSWRKEQTIDFRDLGLFAIVGETGAGKSSLLEAIVYALYNASTFSARDVRALISDGEQTMRVSLEFEAEGERWRVTRSTSVSAYPPPIHQLVCLSNDDEPPIEREGPVNARIEQLVGLNYKGFTSAVLLPQGRFQTLLVSSEGDRSAVLKGIFRLDELGLVRERADAVRRRLERPLDDLRKRRAGMLDDPAAVARTQGEILGAATARLAILRRMREDHDGALHEAERLSAERMRVAAAASRLQRQADDVTSLDEAEAAEAELAAERRPLQIERADYAAARDEARHVLAVAAAGVETIETTTRACQTLHEAGTRLPELGVAEARLRSEADGLAEAENRIDAAAAEHEAEQRRLATEASRVATLGRAADEAEEQLRRAAYLLAVLRQRASEMAARRTSADAARHREEEARHAEVGAKEAEATARAELKVARARYEDTRRRESAAAAAVGVGPGDECPICARTLPRDFEAPLAPDLEKAHRAFHATEEGVATAARQAAAAEMQRAEAERGAGEAGRALEDAERAFAASRAEATKLFLEEVDLQGADAEALGPATRAAREARREATNAAAELAGAEASCKALGRHMAEQREQGARERERIRRQAADVASARQRLIAALDALPLPLRADSHEQADLIAATAMAEARLAKLREQSEAESAAVAAIERVEGLLAELDDERLRRVLTPRRVAAAQATGLRALLGSLPDPRLTPQAPADDAPLAAHIEWMQMVVTAAREEVATLKLTTERLRVEADAASARQGAALEAADNADPEHKISNADSLSDAVEDWGVRERTARELSDQAEAEIETAARTDEAIAALDGLRRACDEVARLLTDARFIRWLVIRRQRALLEVGSDRLLEITGGRYGFADDFRIVDRRTGQPRSARTLSGGETFQASLALALGMIELAARGGGRIGSFYLDEGFGSLDPNALDEALTALEQRAQSGELIAVISHVAAVAERLQDVLRVTTGPGGSEIEALDAKARVALIEVAEVTAELAP